MDAPSGLGPGALIRIAEILGPHGLRGEVRLRSFAAPPSDIAAYSPLLSADGARRYEVTALRPGGASPDIFIARLAGVATREEGEALAGLALHVARERLAIALEEGEFLHADLVGCRVETASGQPVGEVVAVQNFGAGDLVEIALAGTRRTELVPFAESFVPVVDLAHRRIVVSAELGG